jgi:hypothetical protein
MHLQVGCDLCWTVKRPYREDLRQYCKIYGNRLDHKGHGPHAPPDAPHLQRRPHVSERARDLMGRHLLAGYQLDRVITAVRDHLKRLFAEDPLVPAGKVRMSLLSLHLGQAAKLCRKKHWILGFPEETEFLTLMVRTSGSIAWECG